jgi:hypothetical protein
LNRRDTSCHRISQKLRFWGREIPLSAETLFRDVSVERIMRMLTKLGCKVDIVVKPPGRKRAFGPIRLDAV